MHLERASLPGVGTSVRFPTEGGHWVGVINHLDGRRDLVVYSVEDPDTADVTLRLTEQEAHELSTMLYPHHVVEA